MVCPAWQLDCLILFEEAIPIEDPRSGSNFGEITRTQKEIYFRLRPKEFGQGKFIEGQFRRFREKELRLKKNPYSKADGSEGCVDCLGRVRFLLVCLLWSSLKIFFPPLKIDCSEFQVSDLKMPFHDSNVYIVV